MNKYDAFDEHKERMLEFRRENLIQWENILNELFPIGRPNYCEWADLTSITSILKTIGAKPNSNHTFMPSGGGLDLTDVIDAGEPDTVSLVFGEASLRIVRPIKLMFFSFGDHVEWAYFRLETGGLAPTRATDAVTEMWEQLTVLEPGYYADAIAWEQGFQGYDENGDEIPLPESASRAIRFFNGDFVIFASASAYNANPNTYDARHNKMTSNEFNTYISNIVGHLEITKR